jgi:hypothetical protein
MGEKRMNKVLISLPLVMSAWRNNYAVDVKISTAAYLTLRASSFRKGHFLSRVPRTNFGQFLLKRESQVMWQLLGNK